MDQLEAELETLSAGTKKKKRSEDNARQEECQVNTSADLKGQDIEQYIDVHLRF